MFVLFANYLIIVSQVDGLVGLTALFRNDMTVVECQSVHLAVDIFRLAEDELLLSLARNQGQISGGICGNLHDLVLPSFRLFKIVDKSDHLPDAEAVILRWDISINDGDI